MIKWGFVLSFISLIVGCASFPKSKEDVSFLSKDSVEGAFEVIPILDSIHLGEADFHSIFEKLHKDYGHGIRAIQKIDEKSTYTFNINREFDNYLTIRFVRNKEVFKSFNVCYKKKEDGWFYLKNENTKVSGIPYLYGGIEVDRVKVNEDSDLLVEEVHHSSGAFLFIFGDSKTWCYKHIFKRVI